MPDLTQTKQIKIISLKLFRAVQAGLKPGNKPLNGLIAGKNQVYRLYSLQN
jgi:hypothetical protein